MMKRAKSQKNDCACTGAVSYTHLDVYKRQVWKWSKDVVGVKKYFDPFDTGLLRA